MKIPIVNEQDEVLYYKERSETTREEIRRITALQLFNYKDEVLIAKRGPLKAHDPNLWGPAVAGTVEEGETYDSNVIKEVGEEIGLFNIEPIFLKKLFYETYNARRFTSVYYIVINSEERELVLQESEVSEIKWISVYELEKWFIEKPEEFIPSFSRTMETIKEIIHILQNENKN